MEDESVASQNGVVAAYCGSLFEFSIYARFSPFFVEYGLPITLITALASVNLQAKWAGIRCHLIPPIAAIQTEGGLDSSLWTCLEKIHAYDHIYGFLIWSRQTSQSAIACGFANQHSIKTVYLEINALAPKIFFDPAGIDGDSLIYRFPELLDAYETSVEDASEWRRVQIESRRRLADRTPKRKTNLWFFIDWLGTLRTSGGSGPKLHDKIADRLFASRYRTVAADDCPSSYYLLALQIEGNQSRSADYAITKFAIELARRAKVGLMAKAHPSDRDRKFLKFLTDLRDGGHLHLTMEESFELVNNSKCVITRNSAVGLEARLLERKLIAAEPSLYAELSLPRLAALAEKHMLDFDPRGSERLSNAAGRRIVSAFEVSAIIRNNTMRTDLF